MIRLTILYNLPEGAEENEFLEWRLSEHQKSNESLFGVIRTDFARILDSWPGETGPAYTFQTTVDWPDLESFKTGFYDGQVQSALAKNLQKLGDHQFYVSEILSESNTTKTEVKP